MDVQFKLTLLCDFSFYISWIFMCRNKHKSVKGHFSKNNTQGTCYCTWFYCISVLLLPSKSTSSLRFSDYLRKGDTRDIIDSRCSGERKTRMYPIPYLPLCKENSSVTSLSLFFFSQMGKYLMH